jgi:hypothetical protein
VIAPAPPGRPRSRARAVLGAVALLFVTATAAYLLWDRAQGVEPPQPFAEPSREVWVRMHVTARADATEGGRAWDLDGSGPDLRVRVHVRDEVVEVGPCADNLECVQSWDRVRLAPNVPFRVRVDDMEGPFENALGAVWMRWRGESPETLRTRVGSVSVEIRLQRESAPPASPSALPPAAPPRRSTPPVTTIPAPTPRPATPSRRRRRDAGVRDDKPPEQPPVDIAF